MKAKEIQDYNKWLTEVWHHKLHIPFIEDTPKAYLDHKLLYSAFNPKCGVEFMACSGNSDANCFRVKPARARIQVKKNPDLCDNCLYNGKRTIIIEQSIYRVSEKEYHKILALENQIKLTGVENYSKYSEAEDKLFDYLDQNKAKYEFVGVIDFSCRR